MKKNCFKGTIHADHAGVPGGWREMTREHPWLRESVLIAARHSDTPFRCVTHDNYACCEYTTRLNLFTFGKARFRIPVTVVGLPVSMDQPGYSGSLEALIADYRRRRGLFLLLNLEPAVKLPRGFAKAATLGTCVFHNPFSSFEEYLDALRSGYRRRVRKALARGKALELRRIAPEEFSGELHQLYLNVVSRSKYPLEILEKEFFQQFPGEIYALYHENQPVGFFSVAAAGDSASGSDDSATAAGDSASGSDDSATAAGDSATVSGSSTADAGDFAPASGNCLHFIFGGMDYRLRDSLDLYYNMLLAILKLGIDGGYRRIDFGQTAEAAKYRLGCVAEPLSMAAFCRNGLLNFLIQRLLPLLSYREPGEPYTVFKDAA